MHISSVELVNIKSHTSSTFHFEKGTTAITGENGAGKTTILEAIAWVLFDVLDYKKEVFIRRGAEKGSVKVTFESGLDERRYVVFRDTGTAYYVDDPRLRTRLANKKDEVYRFLWQHLGLEPGTDLKSLFRQAIGVPQGTFTAIFLEGATDRKIAFDRLLKVEEYRQAAEKLRETARFLDNSVRDIRETIARAEGELTRSDIVTAEHSEIGEMVESLAQRLTDLAEDLSRRQVSVAGLDAEEAKVRTAKTELDRARAEAEKAEIVDSQTRQALTRAEQAAELIERSRADFERHRASLDKLKGLEERRTERDRIRFEMSRIETAAATLAADRKRMADDLASAERASREIGELRPKSIEQEAVETESKGLREIAAGADDARRRLADIAKRRDELREAYRANHTALKGAEEQAVVAQELATLESRHGELMMNLAGLQASLEHDERFQSEIKNGLCPVLSQKCLNLGEGLTLEGFVTSQFTELRSRIGTVEGERSTVSAQMAVAREAARASGAVDTLRTRQAELTRDGSTIAAEITSLETKLATLTATERRLAESEDRLKALDDPSGRIRLLEPQAAKVAEIAAAMLEADKSVDALARDLKRLEGQFEGFREIDAEFIAASKVRDETADAHRMFVIHEQDAGELENRRTQSQEAARTLATLGEKLRELERSHAEIARGYSAETHAAERTALLADERSYAETRARLDTANVRQSQLAAELGRFVELRTSLAEEFREKENLETVAETTAFIRDTLKEAAPRVARNYVHHVSLEANQMFREITGNGEQTLRWADDYSIMLEQDGFERPFVSLSGGEQMSAALAIRLALLKQLSDIRIAFFDEPTTNMDLARRENFAAQISRITHFDQLFVISHDDTFEEYVDRTLHIG